MPRAPPRVPELGLLTEYRVQGNFSSELPATSRVRQLQLRTEAATASICNPPINTIAAPSLQFGIRHYG